VRSEHRHRKKASWGVDSPPFLHDIRLSESQEASDSECAFVSWRPIVGLALTDSLAPRTPHALLSIVRSAHITQYSRNRHWHHCSCNS
jgi:hypothetical protein